MMTVSTDSNMDDVILDEDLIQDLPGETLAVEVTPELIHQDLVVANELLGMLVALALIRTACGFVGHVWRFLVDNIFKNI